MPNFGCGWVLSALATTIPNAKLIYVMRHPVERAYSHYVHRYTKEIHPGQPITKGFEEFVATDPMCIDSSDYMQQIEQYLEWFPRESILFLLTETLESDPSELLQETFRFLGVDSCIDLQFCRIHNAAGLMDFHVTSWFRAQNGLPATARGR